MVRLGLGLSVSFRGSQGRTSGSQGGVIVFGGEGWEGACREGGETHGDNGLKEKEQHSR